MFIYKAFKITDEKGINEFLSKYSDLIPQQGGIKYVGETVVFMRHEKKLDPADPEKDALYAAAYKYVLDKKTELMGFVVDLRYWRRQALKGEKDAAKNIVDTVNLIDDLKLNIEMATSVMNDIKSDKDWMTEEAPAKKAKK